MRASDYHHLYQTSAWKKIRAQHLNANPLCVMCEQDGRAVKATVLDHVTPHKGDRSKFFKGPFQGLCKTHHDSTKARQESRGVAPGADAQGIPLDPKHHWHQKGAW